MALAYSQLKLQGFGPGHPEGLGWAMKIQGIVSLCPTGIIPPPPPPPTGAILTGFSVTTSSGTITISWGDGTSDVTASNSPISHTFFCITSDPGGFWSQIDPCP